MVISARHALAATLALVAMCSVASADSPTGLVVVGDANLKGSLATALDGWLTHHGRLVSNDPLDRDGILTITNCLNLQDLACARAVVEKRAKTDGVVFAQIASTKEKTVTVQVFWILKGHEAVAERRACEECSADALAGTVDAIMKVLSPSAGNSGRIKIDSKPTGATVVLDHEVIGVAPIERDVAAGPHEVVLMNGSHEVGRRSLTVHATETAEITIPVHEIRDVAPAPRHSRVPAAIVLGVGIAGVVTGTLLYVKTPKDDGSQPTYYDTKPAGIGIGIGGVAAVAIGLVWLNYARTSDSAPVASIGSHGGMIGWARAF
jgi:hypothetical protein